MKIEKVNDHQIRCTLTGADLANRQLKISELAYGSEKAKRLFRDMMQQASFEFGFEAEDIPLMIEAIPVNADCIVLIITKVEDPDEIDTRFSKFSPAVSQDDDETDEMDMESLASDIADDVMDLFHKIKNSAKASMKETTEISENDAHSNSESHTQVDPRSLKTTSLTDLCAFSRIVSKFYDQPNILYKNPADSCYYLMLTQGSLKKEQFGKVCNIASEYGSMEKTDLPKAAYYEEHFELILDQDAVSSLSQI